MSPIQDRRTRPGTAMVHGPDASMFERLRRAWRYRELVRNLTRINLLLKYRGSVLGLCWSLFNPLLMMVIYSIAFKFIMRVGIENYELFLLTGVLPWTFFANAVSASTTCVVYNGALIKKVQIPYEAFPLSTAAFHFIQLTLALVVFAPFVLWVNGGATWPNLLYPVILLLFSLFTLGACLAASALNVRYRDVQHFTEVGIALLFWLTPIVYDFDLIPDVQIFGAIDVRTLFMFNPMTLFMNSFHDVLYWGRAPELATLGGLAVWTALSLAVGATIFRRVAPTMAEEI